MTKFRPIEIHFRETSNTGGVASYQVTTKVHFYFDEEMTKCLCEKEYTFENVPFKSEWMGVLGDVYALINESI